MRENDEVFHEGIVMVSDGKRHPQPMRMQLRSETLVLQKEELVYAPSRTSQENPVESKERIVKIIRRKVGGLGLSVKGGAEHKLPILISRIFKDQAADATKQLYIGDAILKVNDVNIEKFKHDDAVKFLKTAGNEVTLTVKHHSAASPFLSRCAQQISKKKNQIYENYSVIQKSKGLPKLQKKWTDVITIPLLMAYITRYIVGTDKVRLNAFEVRNHDSKFMAVIHCDDPHVLDNWIQRITMGIHQLNSQQINNLNRIFLSVDAVSYMTWVEEAKFLHSQPWSLWNPRFLILKGIDIHLFDTPPITSRDWLKCTCSFKIYQSMFKQLQEPEYQDDRLHCFLIQTSNGNSHYMSVEHKMHLEQLQEAWQYTTYKAITKLGSKTFSTSIKGKPVALTLDWNMGFALYDTEAKCYLWKYRFSQLKGSSDDGKSRLKLHFQDSNTKEIETKEMETSSLHSLLFCIHSFLTAKIVSVDPAFLQKT